MKKYYLVIPSIIFLFFVFVSCSNDEGKTQIQNQIDSRPTVPIQNGVVQIGTQVWMTKNLNVSRYRNGDLIPEVQDPTEWSNLTTGAWCYLDNDPTNGAVYGKLYNWYAVNDPRGLAPNGWHIPSDNEWTTVTTFLGGANIAGEKMKATTGWGSSSVQATNSSGFSALPGSHRWFYGPFLSSTIGNWWSSTPAEGTSAWNRSMAYNHSSVGRSNYGWKSGYSVRCVRN